MSAATTNAEACKCRICGQPMERFFQPGLIPGRDGAHFVTCFNEGCAMHAFTLGERGYAELDLTEYLARRPQTAVVIAQSRA